MEHHLEGRSLVFSAGSGKAPKRTNDLSLVQRIHFDQTTPPSREPHRYCSSTTSHVDPFPLDLAEIANFYLYGALSGKITLLLPHLGSQREAQTLLGKRLIKGYSWFFTPLFLLCYLTLDQFHRML